MQGKDERSHVYLAGQHQQEVDVHDLEAGFYVILLRTERKNRVVKIVVVE